MFFLAILTCIPDLCFPSLKFLSVDIYSHTDCCLLSRSRIALERFLLTFFGCFYISSLIVALITFIISVSFLQLSVYCYYVAV